MVAESSGGEWIGVIEAAKLLGLRDRTVRELVDRGELPALVETPRPWARRRTIRIPLAALNDYIARARVKPGELRHLHDQAAPQTDR